jgi:O-antigen biosynthesis protein
MPPMMQSASSAPRTAPVGGVFVIGAEGSGVESVGELLAGLGLTSLSADSDASARLTALNDRLLQAAGGSRRRLPLVAPAELDRALAPHLEEARRTFTDILESSVGHGDGRPWVWADPANSLLLSFWRQALAIDPAVVFVHRGAGETVAAADATGTQTASAALAQWYRYNRAALVLLWECPALVVGFETVAGDPTRTAGLLGELLAGCGVSAEVRLAPALSVSPAGASRVDDSQIGPPYPVFDQLLTELDGLHLDASSWTVSREFLDETSLFYDARYYATSCDSRHTGLRYSRDEPYWPAFFDGVAQAIVERLSPATVLDVGCAIGMLVEALRERGVEARGIDISEWAIEQVPPTLRPYCRVGSLTDAIEGDYDLITCIEVTEHLPPFAAEEAVANLCRHSRAVLFSSTPDDFDEPTHLNVRAGGYWAQLFDRHGFGRDPDFDASVLAPHAVLFRRRERPGDLAGVIDDYERALANVTSRSRHLVENLAGENQLLANRLRAQQDTDVEGQIVTTRGLLHYERTYQRLAALAAQYDAILKTRTFRYLQPLRNLYASLTGRRPAPAEAAPATMGPGQQYELWVASFDELDDYLRLELRDRVTALSERPLVSVVLPVYNTPETFLRSAIESVREQIYPHWELCLADDASTDPGVAQVLDEYSALDDRIKVVRRTENGHICAATNSALALAEGRWVAFLDHDDELPEHALALAVVALAQRPEAGMLYSDEDKLDAEGERHDPYFKPEFDRLLLLGQNYLTHFLVIRRDLVDAVGGMREGFEGSQDWDLVLRVSELLDDRQIVHVPHVLYHWRAHAASTAASLAAKPYAPGAGQRAVVEHLSRTGRVGEVSPLASGHNRVIWPVPQPAPLVSVVVPTRDGPLLRRCLDSLLGLTTYPHLEVVVVDNGSRVPAVLDYLRSRQADLTVIRDERPFNYAALNNEAVKQAAGEVVCLLNDDTEITSGSWLDEMVGQLYQPAVGAVGAKLYYEDGTIQHGGVVLGVGGVAGHAYRRAAHDSTGCMGRLQLAQTMSAVTGACMAVRREAWEQVRGMDEDHLAVAFNDVDFCLRLREAGWRIVWTPWAELSHHESVSRGSETKRRDAFASEERFMYLRWGRVLRTDPAYNPNLSLVAEDFSLAWPPRVSYR